MGRIAAFGFGIFSYALFGVSLLWLLAFLTNIGLPLTIDRGDIAPPIHPFTWNLLLLTLFGLQHSVMARPGFKRWWTRHVPDVIERSLYVFIASAVVIAICLLWKPMPGIVWRAESATAQFAWWAGFGGGFVWLLASSFHIDHFELLGLRQVWSALRRRTSQPPPFVVRGLYRLMRHPIYVGWLLIFWCAPTMSEGRLLFAAGMTVYTLIAIIFEERDLAGFHGDDYARYQSEVPALIPRPRSIRNFFSALAPKLGVFAVLGLAGMLTLYPASTSKLIEAIAVSAETAALPRLRITTDQGERQATIYVPDGVTVTRAVILLHGAGGDPNRLRLLTARGFEKNARDAGWLVVYPHGVGGTWNDCRTVPDYPAKRNAIDDVAFIESLVAELRSRYALTAKPVLLGGFSNGGHMALRVASERPGLVEGIAIVAAQLPASNNNVCDFDNIRDHILLAAGTHDPVSPFDGGDAITPDGRQLGAVQPFERTLAVLAGQRPARPFDSVRLPDRDARPEWVERRDAVRSDGSLLRAYIVHGGGHTIPGPSEWFPAHVGSSSADITFADELRAFVDTWK